MDFLDRVRVTTATPGQGTVTLGAAVANNFLSVSQAGGVTGQIVQYAIEEGLDFEVGFGTLTVGGSTTMTRTVYRSRIAGTVSTSAKMELGGNAVVRIIESATHYALLEARAGFLKDLPETIYTDNQTITTAQSGRALIGNKATAMAFALPALSTAGDGFYVFKNIGVGALTLDPNASETIDGVASYALGTGVTALVWPDATNASWRMAVIPLRDSFYTKTEVDALVLGQLAPPAGRLSLSTSSVSVADVVGATNIYWVPDGGDLVPIYNGTKFVMRSVAQQTHALDADAGHTNYHQAGKHFDSFIFDDGGTIRLGSGPSWSAGAISGSDVTRGTGAGSTELESVNGILVNKNAIVIRWGSASGNTVSVPARRATYLGSFRTVANGQVTDSTFIRFLFNCYNRVPLQMIVTDANTWTYSVAAWRLARASTANRFNVLLGLPGVLFTAELIVLGTGPTGSNGLVAINFDSTAAAHPDCTRDILNVVTGQYKTTVAKLRGYPGLGYHSVNWLEFGAAVGIQFRGVGNIGMTGEFNG